VGLVLGVCFVVVGWGVGGVPCVGWLWGGGGGGIER